MTDGGKWAEDLALQNIQARSRLVSSYFIAQILNAKKICKKFLLVLGTGNSSEINRGYYTKYDNSSGDLGLIGSLCKEDLKRLVLYYAKEGCRVYKKGKATLEDYRVKMEFLGDIVKAKSSAELRPDTEDTGEFYFSYMAHIVLIF